MPWFYRQETGELTHDSGNVTSESYSGHGVGLNNPAYESWKNIGPIPKGSWRIGETYDSKTTGPHTIKLEPVDIAVTNRADFRIHGDNKAMNKTASHGCIIAPRTVREQITAVAASGDDVLVVI